MIKRLLQNVEGVDERGSRSNETSMFLLTKGPQKMKNPINLACIRAYSFVAYYVAHDFEQGTENKTFLMFS